MRVERCRSEKLVTRHFRGAITPGAERKLREHLPACASCKKTYERQRLWAELDPKAPSAEERLARGLGLSLRPRRAWLPLASVAVAMAAAAAFVIWPAQRRSEAEFVARGAASETAQKPALFVYRIRPGAPPQAVQKQVGRHDELAFAYRNPSGFSRLLIFGVDEHGHVYWYHPAWREAAETPTAIAIEGGPALHELPEAIAHALDGQQLRIYGVFTREVLTVRQIEAALARNDSVARSFTAAAETVLPLEIRR